MDSSSEMCARCETIRNARTVRGDIAASAPRVSGQFDLVTCLWNVLGHVHGAAQRCRALANLAWLLAPDGLLILDVNNRWNVRSYGWRAIRNIVYGASEIAETSGSSSRHPARRRP